MANQNYILSKSSFLRGVQCPKYLYLNTYHKELKDELSDSQRAIFETGNNVGVIAQGLLFGGLNLKPENYSDIDEWVGRTKEAIANGKTILYEAACFNDNTFSAIY